MSAEECTLGPDDLELARPASSWLTGVKRYHLIGLSASWAGTRRAEQWPAPQGLGGF